MPNKITRIDKKNAVAGTENPISGFKSRVCKIKGKLMRERPWVKKTQKSKAIFKSVIYKLY